MTALFDDRRSASERRAVACSVSTRRRGLSERATTAARAQRRGRAAGSASLRRSPRCGDSPALLDPWSHRETRFAHCVRCAQTVAMSQITKRVLRTRRPRVCAARRLRGAAPAAHPHLCANSHLAPAAPSEIISANDGDSRGTAGLDSPRLSERSERSERSEFCGATARRAAQGSRRTAATAAVKRRQPPARGFAPLGFWSDNGRSSHSERPNELLVKALGTRPMGT